ncbi:mediator of RNA polymerase II transcription subunit 16-like [Diaphorina citri]|uniref:Mediator of RNA polymerase II transcription subunit 16 n=1 Tax=Diaphorina citri TaxID=121845 RepID=A0A3Q0JJR4_DIACI|nr:mediator of RNA polymerase II transcription subunit 16-like [Diaphorina citri]
MSSKWTVTTLEWNIYGTYILIGDCSGTVSIYTMNDHMFNDWVQLGSTVFEAEHILGGAFFHSGNKLSLMTEKKDSVSYYEKFNYLRLRWLLRLLRLIEDNCLITISTKNTVAWTTRTEINDTTNTTWASHVYVADLNVPWQYHKSPSCPAVFGREHNQLHVMHYFLFYCRLIEDNCLITISTKNTVAWTTRTEINDTTNTTWASHVYVADLNVPWQYHKVMSSKWTVTTLEWNIYGTYILIGDCSGTVSIYTMNDHMFNDWVQLGSTVFEAEHILGGAFFHSGNKLSLMTEKKDSVSYYEKFNYLRFAPSVRQKGGCALEGCIVISKTGLIGVIVLTKTSHNNTTLLTTAESLAVSRYEITSVDICYGKNGHFLIATSCQDTQMPIKCYEVRGNNLI